MIGNPSAKDQNRGAEVQFDYQWADPHRLTIGTVVERKQMYDTRSIANFDPATGAPLGSLQDITDGGNYILEKTRDIWAAYLQDEWNITEQIDLVAGVRHDRYSDFGRTTNPRVAAVWQFATSWDAKLMYGTAFLAPPFGALYLINNPAQLGNPNLDPEKMRTYEASVGYTAGETEGRISYFNNDFDNKIQPLLQPSGVLIYGNRGGATVQGVEIEVKQRFGLGAEAYANYTYQKGEDTETQRELADVAAHKGNVGVDFSPVKYLNINANLFMVGKKPRALGDPRKDAPGYALLDLTLIGKEIYKGLEIRGSVHNLLDKEYADPLLVVVPGDLPREGRHVMVEALYRF
jgi:iron complex outermembrane receptor protein